MPIFGIVWRFIKKPTSKHVVINTLGNYLNVFFTAFFVLLLVRIFTKSQYGVLSVLLGIAYVLANILDFGTTATIYSYLPPMIERKAPNIYRFIKTTFFYQSVFSGIVIVMLLVTFPTLDKAFFKTGAPLSEMYLTSLMVLFLIWQNFALNILFAAKKFIRANLYLNVSNVIKTAAILLLAATRQVSVGSILFVYGILGPVIFFLLIFLEKKDLVFILLKSDVKREEFRFDYTFTYFVASQFLNLGLRMDLFLLSYFRTKAEVGVYGLSQKIILTIITTIISITQVLSPNFSKIKTKEETFHQLKTGLLYLLVPGLLFFLVFITPNEVFYLFFTEKFAQTAAVTKALSLPFILFSLNNLLNLFLLYTVRKPMPILVANIAFFLVLTVGCYYLIPLKGVFGPPYAIFLAFLIQTLILGVVSVREYKKIPDQSRLNQYSTVNSR